MPIGFSIKSNWKIWLRKHKQNTIFNLVHMAPNLHWFLPFSQVFSDPLTVELRIYGFDWLECSLILSSLLKRSLHYKNNTGEKIFYCTTTLFITLGWRGKKRDIRGLFFLNCTHFNTVIILIFYILSRIWDESSSFELKLVKKLNTAPLGLHGILCI